MFFFINLLLTFAVAIYYLYQKTFYHWRNMGVTQFPFALKKGNLGDVGTKIHLGQFFADYYNRTKQLGLKFSGLYFNTTPELLVTDLDLIRQILIKDFDYFPNHGKYVNEADEPINAHLFNLSDDRWKNMRNKISPVFTSGKLKMMFGTVSDVTDKMLSVIDDEISLSGQIDVKKTMNSFTTDTIGSIAFGLECNALRDEDSEFLRMTKRVFAIRRSRLGRFLRDKVPELAKKLHVKSLPDDVSHFYYEIVRKTILYRIENPHENREDFLKVMVELYQQGNITMDQASAQCYLFFLGSEGVSTAIACCLFELALNSEYQDKARKDVVNAIQSHGGVLNYESLADMHYIDKCVNETLRKYPSGVTLQRSCAKSYHIPGSNVTIPKGQSVQIPTYAIHFDEEIFPNPSVFDPERFSHEESAKRHPMAFLAFGEGPRHCVGVRLAMMIAKLAIAKVLSNYEFELDERKTANPLKLSLTSFILTPLEAIVINMKKIQKK